MCHCVCGYNQPVVTYHPCGSVVYVASQPALTYHPCVCVCGYNQAVLATILMSVSMVATYHPCVWRGVGAA